MCSPAPALGDAVLLCEYSPPDAGTAEAQRQSAEALRAIGESLAGAFPTGAVRSVAVPSHHRFLIAAGGKNRTLAVTQGALLSPNLRTYLRELPEALNFTTSILLTENGITADDSWPEPND